MNSTFIDLAEGMSCTAFLRLFISFLGGKSMSIPKDPAILLSFINTKLRDEYPSFEELCKSLCIGQNDIVNKLSALGYTYDQSKNRFI